MKLPAAAVAALHEGRKIEAIKIVRQENGVDLKAAKDAVEAYVRSQPGLQASFEAGRLEATRRLLGWLAGVALVLVGLYFFLKR